MLYNIAMAMICEINDKETAWPGTMFRQGNRKLESTTILGPEFQAGVGTAEIVLTMNI